MRIRPFVLLCYGVTTLLLTVGLYALASRFLLRSYEKLERQEAARDLQRAEYAFRQIGSDLHLKTVDWSEWDDTYRYMADRNRAYINSNMVEASIAKMGMDLVMLVDARRRIVFALPVRRRADALPPVPAGVLKALVTGPAASALMQSSEGFYGLLDQPAHPLIVSVRPILRSNGAGPPRGWLLFGRYFDEAERAGLSQRTRLEIQAYPMHRAGTPPDCRQALTRVSSLSSPVLLPLSASTLGGYRSIEDLHQRPLLALRVLLPRRIYQQGLLSRNLLVQLIVMAALIFSGVTLLILDRLVLARLSRLSGQVEQIGTTAGLSRVFLPGRDELTRLAGRINGMLDTLDAHSHRLRESEEQLRVYSENLEALVEQRTRQIEHQAFHDGLTDLPNRILFMDRIEQARARATRQRNGLALIFLDLDNFKVINDSQGHEAGDLLLRAVAERLQGCLRPGDTVARLGGDEFTLLLEDLPHAGDALRVAERILERLRAPVRLPRSEAFISCSIGIAYSETGSEEPEDLLRNADTAMYHAKINGKGGFVLFNSVMNDHLSERLELETGLRRALEQGELRVYYQPLLDLETGLVAGVEALVRWQHPTRGLITPGQFIPIAEETGLIIPLGYWVLEEACRQMKAWSERYPDHPPMMLNVNLSGKQLQRADIVERVAAVLNETGLPAQQLKLEITESVFMSNMDEVAAKLRRLKALGVKLAIDDFGTGYSSMSYLSAFPVDTIKIDRTFISRLSDQEDAAAVVAAIIMLSKTMQMDVTGEGIETEEQVAQLQGMGCNVGQGFFYSHPLTDEALEEHLRSGRHAFYRSVNPAGKEQVEQLLNQIYPEGHEKAA